MALFIRLKEARKALGERRPPQISYLPYTFSAGFLQHFCTKILYSARDEYW